jgi:hypothetical protein
VLAAYLANRRLAGDPVWLILVGGSGTGKTERLTPLAGLPDVVLESSITGPAALLSGTGRKERAKDATGGILRKLPEGGGVLLLKDFTSVLDMHRDARAEVLAALREVYDGRWDRSVGVDGGKTLTFIGHVGLIAGCTTAIDSAHAVIASMGTRFVFLRMHGDDVLADAVLGHVGDEKPMRDELRAVVDGFLQHPPGVPHEINARRDQLAALGSLVALARSPIDRDHQGEIRLVLDAEAPTRIVKMLAQLWRAAGLLGLDHEQAWALVHRIGMDSIPKLRRLVLDYLATQPTITTTANIVQAVEHPYRTTKRALEDLTAHRVVRRLARDSEDGNGRSDYWGLTDKARQWYRDTVPASSGSIDTSSPEPDTSLYKYKTTLEDKTGTVTGPVSLDEVTDESHDGDKDARRDGRSTDEIHAEGDRKFREGF